MFVRHGNWDSFPDHIRWRQPPASYLPVQADQAASPAAADNSAEAFADAATASPQTSAGRNTKRSSQPGLRARGLLGRLMGRLLQPWIPR